MAGGVVGTIGSNESYINPLSYQGFQGVSRKNHFTGLKGLALMGKSLASTALLPPTPFVWYEILRFVPFFLMRSLLGGADVAWHAFHPGLPIAPDLIEYRLRLPPGLSQVLMVNTVSLLPGTLSVALDWSVLKVHVLDSRCSFLAELEALEKRMARICGITLKLSARGL